MKKLILLFSAFVISLSVFGHAAKKVELSYDKESGELTVTITHPVKDETKHYIDEVSIEVNGEIVKTEAYTKQMSSEKQVIKIKLENIKAGDKIEANTHCNKGGNRGGSIEIE